MTIIQAHPDLCLFLGYLIFCAVAGGMPPPEQGSGVGYRWLHGSLNLLALNLQSVVRARVPEASCLDQPKELSPPST